FYHPKWDEQDCPVRREPFKVLLTRNRNHLFDPSNENTLATSHFERRGTYYFFHWPFIRHEENAAIQFQLNALAYQHLDAAKEAVKVINAWVRRMRISNTAIISIDASKSYAESTQTDCGIHLISAYEGPAENPPTKLLMTVSGISKYEGAITDVDAWMNLNTIRSHEELALGEDLPKEVMTRWFVYVFLRALGGNDATGSRVSFLD
ncbi:MAG: hypothetical protein KDD52_10320, partial [Bdellovibrionales bacterium]|nr:hypothetical protein [Bdellovibrionales bacterium]